MNHGNRPCRTGGGAQPAADAFFSAYDGAFVIYLYGMYITPVDAGKAGATGIVFFFGIIVRCSYHSRIIVFGDEPQDPAAVAAAVSYKCLGAYLVCRAVNQTVLFGLGENLLCLLLGNLPPQSVLDVEIRRRPEAHAGFK